MASKKCIFTLPLEVVQTNKTKGVTKEEDCILKLLFAFVKVQKLKSIFSFQTFISYDLFKVREA